jgi:heptosyltransferase-1
LPPLKEQLRVLIVRLGAMGDILHALPAVTALRAVHPEWTIGWAVEPHWRPLLCAKYGSGASATNDSGRRLTMPLVDRLHMVAAKSWGRKPFSRETLGDIRRVRRELRAAQYDVCVDLQGAVRSALIGRWARPDRMIGEEQPREFAARWLFGEKVATRGVHVIEQALEVAGAIACEQLPFLAPELPHDSRAEEWCARFVEAKAWGPMVLMNPGAGWGAKQWPAAWYGQVASMLAERGYFVVVNTRESEEALGAELVKASGNTAMQVDPSLGELISLTRLASLMITGDTGPLHLACALGKPVVGIFGPTDPARNGPYGCEHRVLRHPESKRDHSRRAEPEAGLLTIQPEAVFAAALDLLQESE